ncbi:MAG: FAD-dependent oxidoreductase, partial [Granulosicoccus sp.]|nr:FAD-dependent oxidoreductase [Granulosicoccus sp.]
MKVNLYVSQASVELTRAHTRRVIEPAKDSQPSRPPVIIVGNGPVGVRTMTEIFNRDRKIPIILYGDETHLPYDRVKLSLWLTGELDLNEISNRYRRPFGSSLEERFGRRVVAIDRQQKSILDSTGETTTYDKLILATGSQAYVPDIEGINSEGVFTLRNIDDATSLFARRNRSRHTIIIGGGLLGLEAARSMQPANTKVSVIEHSDRLMANQLDIEGASILRETLESKGFTFIVGDGIKRILGDPRVTGVQTNSGKTIDCDTIVVATGIKPNIELARNAGLAFGRGIQVNNHLQTSDPSIYAVGECAEHQREVYGLV